MDKLGFKQPETTTDLLLRWGNKKRLRCARMRDPEDVADQSFAVSGRRRIRRRINSRSVAYNNNNKGNTEMAVNLRSENNQKSSPENKPSVFPVDGGEGGQKVKHVWPKLYITLSNKEKEEDFMAMKGCKPSHRPKKRPKIIQRSLLLVSPGEWLTDICQDRYEVIEKKNTKKRPRGLKAMGSMESDSE